MSSLSWVTMALCRGDCRISLPPEVRFDGLCDLEHIIESIWQNRIKE